MPITVGCEKGTSRYIAAMNSSRQLRDLTWVIQSQSLLTNSVHTKIDPLAIDRDHLARFLSEEKGHRVGRYFERLVLYWLTYVRKVEVIAASLQVRDGKRTIGEIDLLFRDERGRVNHWEIAVKFYLHLSQHTFLDSHYIGPNAGDTLERKMERLFVHQLPRSKGRFPEVEIRQAFVKGRLFYHAAESPPETLPQKVSPNHTRCKWIRESETELLFQSESLRYKVLHKPFWLSEESLATDEGLLSPTEQTQQLAAHFATTARPVLISQLQAAGDGFQETDRFFVVSDRWPTAAQPTK